MDSTPDRPIGFGYKCAWLTVRHGDPSDVARSLDLANVQPCNWLSGFRAIYGPYAKMIFVTPAINGWVLAAGWGVPTFEGTEFGDRLTPLLDSLGKRYTDVQHFATHRFVDYHSWSRVRDCNLVKSFIYCGDSSQFLRDVGEPDEVERNLRAKHRKRWHPAKYAPTYKYHPNEEHVTAIAAAWSLDPTGLDQMDLPASSGLLGLPRG